MFKSIHSISFSGTKSLSVNVEISANKGLPQETLIGLPDTVIKESRARIKSAILLSGFEFPAMSYVINLSPTDIIKRNLSLELAISVAILSVTDQISIDSTFCFIGSISLDGHITPTRQILPLIYNLSNYLDYTYVISKDNELDLAPLDQLNYITISHLSDLKQLNSIKPKTIRFKPQPSHSSVDQR